MDITRIKNQIKNAPEYLEELMAEIPEDRLDKTYSRHWSVKHHLIHLVITQKILNQRIECYLLDENPVVNAYVPPESETNSEEEMTIQELMAEYRSLKEKQLALVEKTDESIWSKVGKHPEYGNYPFTVMINHILFHDFTHFYRMEELGLVKEEFITTW